MTDRVCVKCSKRYDSNANYHGVCRHHSTAACKKKFFDGQPVDGTGFVGARYVLGDMTAIDRDGRTLTFASGPVPDPVPRTGKPVARDPMYASPLVEFGIAYARNAPVHACCLRSARPKGPYARLEDIDDIAENGCWSGWHDRNDPCPRPSDVWSCARKGIKYLMPDVWMMSPLTNLEAALEIRDAYAAKKYRQALLLEMSFNSYLGFKFDPFDTEGYVLLWRHPRIGEQVPWMSVDTSTTGERGRVLRDMAVVSDEEKRIAEYLARAIEGSDFGILRRNIEDAAVGTISMAPLTSGGIPSEFEPTLPPLSPDLMDQDMLVDQILRAEDALKFPIENIRETRKQELMSIINSKVKLGLRLGKISAKVEEIYTRDLQRLDERLIHATKHGDIVAISACALAVDEFTEKWKAEREDAMKRLSDALEKGDYTEISAEVWNIALTLPTKIDGYYRSASDKIDAAISDGSMHHDRIMDSLQPSGKASRVMSIDEVAQFVRKHAMKVTEELGLLHPDATTFLDRVDGDARKSGTDPIGYVVRYYRVLSESSGETFASSVVPSGNLRFDVYSAKNILDALQYSAENISQTNYPIRRDSQESALSDFSMAVGVMIKMISAGNIYVKTTMGASNRSKEAHHLMISATTTGILARRERKRAESEEAARTTARKLDEAKHRLDTAADRLGDAIKGLIDPSGCAKGPALMKSFDLRVVLQGKQVGMFQPAGECIVSSIREGEWLGTEHMGDHADMDAAKDIWQARESHTTTLVSMGDFAGFDTALKEFEAGVSPETAGKLAESAEYLRRLLSKQKSIYDEKLRQIMVDADARRSKFVREMDVATGVQAPEPGSQTKQAPIPEQPPKLPPRELTNEQFLEAAGIDVGARKILSDFFKSKNKSIVAAFPEMAKEFGGPNVLGIYGERAAPDLVTDALDRVRIHEAACRTVLDVLKQQKVPAENVSQTTETAVAMQHQLAVLANAVACLAIANKVFWTNLGVWRTNHELKLRTSAATVTPMELDSIIRATEKTFAINGIADVAQRIFGIYERLAFDELLAKEIAASTSGRELDGAAENLLDITSTKTRPLQGWNGPEYIGSEMRFDPSFAASLGLAVKQVNSAKDLINHGRTLDDLAKLQAIETELMEPLRIPIDHGNELIRLAAP